MPWPFKSVLTVPGTGGAVSSITVEGQQILSAGIPAKASGAELAIALQDSINKCSFETTDTTCGVAGYRAIASLSATGVNIVSIYAPKRFTANITPNVTGSVALSPTPFASINTNYVGFGGSQAGIKNEVVGINLPTVIFPGIQKYPKETGRADCKADYCTYEEEMTNYANWHAYYRTRMQMMKTGTSLAFSTTTDSFRIGFMTVNNQTGTDSMGSNFLNIKNFNSQQKHDWYVKLFATQPKGDTPLRQALDQAGRIYAGRLKGVYGIGDKGVSIIDPVQHSCQMNVTILSTDGYWNEGPGVRLDGTTTVGDQDSSKVVPEVLRPQLDGGQPTFTITSEQYIKYKEPQNRPQARVTTTKADHYQLQVSKKDVMQKTTSPLQARVLTLQKTIWPLQTQQAQLQTQWKKLYRRDWGTYQLIAKWDVTAYKIQQTTTNYKMEKIVRQLQKTVTPLKETLHTVKRTLSQLQRTPHTLVQSDYQLQISHAQQAQKSLDGGVTWQDVDSCEIKKYGSTQLCRYSGAPVTSWTNVPDEGKCTPMSITSDQVWDPSNPNRGVTVDAGGDKQREVFATQTSCRYDIKTSTPTTCKPTKDSIDTNITSNSVVQATLCSYTEGAAVDVTTGSCTPGSASSGAIWEEYETCSYKAVESKVIGDADICTVKNESSGSTDAWDVLIATKCEYSGLKEVGSALEECVVTGGQVTSTDNDTVYKAYAGCAYTSSSTQNVTGNDTCTPRDKDAASPYKAAVSCAYTSVTTSVSPSQCTPSRLPGNTCADSGSTLSCTEIVTCGPSTPQTPVTSNPNTCVESSNSDQVITCGSVYQWKKEDQVSCPANSGGFIYDCLQKGGEQVCGGANQPGCGWTWSVWREVQSCTATTLTSPAAGFEGDATQCKYADSFSCDAGIGCWSDTNVACTPNSDSTITVNKPMKPLVSCKYTAYSTATNVVDGASCTADTTVTTGSSTLGDLAYQKPLVRKCGYWKGNAVITPASSCTQTKINLRNQTAAGGVTYQGNLEYCAYTQTQAWTKVDSCTRQPYPVIQEGVKVNQEYATQCQYGTAVVTTVPVGEACVPSDPACTFPTATTCSGTQCASSATCTVGQAVTCTATGWSDWIDVGDGGSCKADGNNSTTGTVKCRYNSIGPRYYVGDAVKNCADINRPRTTNFTVANVPLTAVENCTKNWIIPESDAWLDINVDLKNNFKITAGTTGTLGNNSYTFNAEFLPEYEPIPDSKPNSSGIKTVAGYNLETREGPANQLPISQEVVENCGGITSPDDTPLHNIVTCNRVETGKQEKQISCPTLEEMKPTAANNWTTKTCVEVMGDATDDTLADVAQYYYMTDLRTENCTSAAGNDLCINNMKPTKDDPATWQHMVTYTLGLGASGFMQYDPNYRTADTGDFPAIAKGKASNLAEGLCSWQLNNTTCNWPKPVTASQTNIDDLWHAAVNGRGVYYSAGEPTALSRGLQDALGSIGQKEGSSSGVTLASPILTEGNNFVFYGGYTDGAWTGELIARKINLVTGMVEQDYCWYEDEPDVKLDCPASSDGTLPLGMKKKVVDPVWTAQEKLDNKTPGTRRIYTYAGIGAKKTFEWSELTTDEQLFFSETHISSLPQMCKEADISCLSEANRQKAAGENLVNFLRGDRTHEDSDKIGFYRKREHLLGDIVNAAPAYVRGSNFLYTDKGYWKFKMDTQNRRPMVYAAANDGMLHAFYAEDDLPQEKVGGAEAWAYVPGLVMPNLFNLASKNYKENHRFFVDGTPVVGDICIANCPSAKEQPPAVWKTILVGGLNHGGNGYYALDITDPENPEVLWEFTHVNMGYTYGNPVITKLKPEGKWVVMFTSGYNNVLPSKEDNTKTGDGKGHLFIVDALTGELFEDRVITTGVGSTTEPSGLSRINVWVDYPLYDNTAERVYGGDLFGNLWRFDINGHGTANSYYAQLLAVLKNKDDVIQPITAKPELGKIDNKPIVFVGTGKLLGPTDMLSASWQSFYGIYDPVFDVETTAITASEAIYDNPRSLGNNFVKQLFKSELCTIEQIEEDKCEMVGGKAELTTRAVDFSQGKKGWYVDFMVKAERADTDSYLTRGTIVINTNVPTEATECAPGGYNNRYYINAATGGAFGEGDWGDAGGYRSEGLVANTTVGVVGDRMIDYNQIDGRKDIDEGEPPFEAIPPIPRRLSWRQLLTDN